jgi:hypothetical protein
LFRSKTTLKIKAILLCKTVSLYFQVISADPLIFVGVVTVFALGGFIGSILPDVLYIKM